MNKVTAIAWKEQLLFRQLYNPFIAAKNDWDATPTKVGFAMNTSSPELIILDYASADGANGRTYVDRKPAEVYLNWNYLVGDNDTRRRSTTGHEIGHALGLGHTANAALMNDVRDRDTIYIPKDEDIKGVNAIYGYP